MELREGMRVELCSSEDGYGGAWFEGVIVAVTAYGWRCKIRYDKFVTNDGKPLEEEVWLHSEVRPIPPHIQLPLRFSAGDAVEAYDTDCWWRGFIIKLLTGAEEELWAVYFTDTRSLKAYPRSDLRPAQEWRQGNWVLAPQENRAVIEQVIQYFALDNLVETPLTSGGEGEGKKGRGADKSKAASGGQEILEDLQRFQRGEKYYRQVGRAWKRGYLLYGPPGTGKSSMIAAMANFLDYDIYDLELTQVKSNTELRKLLIATTNKSIIVIEDIDCSLDLSDRKKKKKKEQKEGEEKEKASEPSKTEENEAKEESKVTLSGVLNFTDGLWSCCGSERLFVFTTNHIDRLDPALLRSGRMDKHILLSFCKFGAFKALARNYLSIEDHELYPEIQELIEAAEMTPADVTEHLMKMNRDPAGALKNLIDALRDAKERRGSAALNGSVCEENASATVEGEA